MEAVVIKVGDSALHLKTLVVWLGKDVGLVAKNSRDGHVAGEKSNSAS